MGTNMSQLICGRQRTALWSLFSPFTLMWVPEGAQTWVPKHTHDCSFRLSYFVHSLLQTSDCHPSFCWDSFFQELLLDLSPFYEQQSHTFCLFGLGLFFVFLGFLCVALAGNLEISVNQADLELAEIHLPCPCHMSAGIKGVCNCRCCLAKTLP